MPTQGLIAIDQGTTSSRAILFSVDGDILASAQSEFPQHYPADGWVEHDPEDIWTTTRDALHDIIDAAASKNITPTGIGITNQRETVVLWDRATGTPIYPAIVWQDRRTAKTCRTLREDGHSDLIRTKTGLEIDPYFSATKIAWILDHVEGARAKAERGDLACGTIDTFLIWRLTGGKVHATDATNASRTSLYNIENGEWDEELLSLYRVPAGLLPVVQDCAAHFGDTDPTLLGVSLPILGVAGDQQAASIGQACFTPGATKSTYGTGCFMLMNTGREIIRSQNRLLSTVAYQLDGQRHYAIEGSIFIAGAAVQWLRDELHLITDSAETALRAQRAAPDSQVVMVPAFAGLGAPHWNPHARGAIFGMTRATGPDEIAKATLEGIAFQTHDLLTAMAKDGLTPASLRIDGGMAGNDWFMQLLADLADLQVDRPAILETTALGAAYLAGLTAGIYSSTEDIAARWKSRDSATPNLPTAQRHRALDRWAACVTAVLSVAVDEATHD